MSNRTVLVAAAIALVLGGLGQPWTAGADPESVGSSQPAPEAAPGAAPGAAAKRPSRGPAPRPAAPQPAPQAAPQAAPAPATLPKTLPKAPLPAVAPIGSTAPAPAAPPAGSSPATAPKSVVRAEAPSPTSTVSTQYGNLGQWMINSKNQIADWVGVPYQGRTMLEGINVVIVDSASGTASQAASNLNAWMTRSGFAPSAISSTGYKGVIETTTFGQQPVGASAAFRDAYFLLANSHGRVFGPYPNPGGPGFIWTASLSEENLDLQNLTHGYESFNTARARLVGNMVAAGAGNLGQVFMDNVYNTEQYTTGDADGYAAVIGLTQVLKTATPPRGGAVGGKR